MTATIQRPVARITRRPARPAGYTVIEILVALTISLVMMLVVVTIIGRAGTSIATSRATLEMSDRLRETQARLAQDLQGITVTMSPPRDPAANEGYFEYTEGPVGPVVEPSSAAVNLNDPNNPQPDTTVGDVDDMLLFTTHNETHPFVGRLGASGTIQSADAEVAWFVRGRTLYRRVLLVAPQCINVLDTPLPSPDHDGLINSTEWGGGSFFNGNDISVRRVVSGGNVYLVPNTLGDLTKPENRYAHQPTSNASPAGYPYHPHTAYSGRTDWFNLRMPLLCETAASSWFSTWFGTSALSNAVLPAVTLTPKTAPYNQFDAWTNPYRYQELDPITGALSVYGTTRIGEDVILTNVIGFDVKAWDLYAPVVECRDNKGTPADSTDDSVVAILPGDPAYNRAFQYRDGIDPANGNISYTVIGQGTYVDLGYAQRAMGAPTGLPGFADLGNPKSGLATLAGGTECVYDTWSTHYESDGLKEVGNTSGLTTDAGTNGFDDDSNGVVDDALEQETSPPYPVTLRGIQIKIRIFEPDSRQVREVTIVEKF